MKIKACFFILALTLLLAKGYVVEAQESESELASQKPIPKLLETEVLDPLYGNQYQIKRVQYGYRSYRDFFLSPLLYEGFSIGSQNEEFHYRNNRLVHTQFSNDLGILVNRQNDSNVIQLEFGYSYAQLFPIDLPSAPEWRFFWGPELSAIGNINMLITNVNNPFAHLINLNLGTAALAEYKFELWNRPWMVSNHLRVPLLSTFSRNLYSWLLPEVGQEALRPSEYIQVGTWNRFLQIQNTLALDFHLIQKRRKEIRKKVPYRLSYTWTYRRIPEPNLSHWASHQIGIARIIKL